MKSSGRYWSFIAAVMASAMFSMPAQAVPSFARQTGVPCSACHTNFPELTQFGRSFKLNGYVLSGGKEIQAEPSGSAAGLNISEFSTLSAMTLISDTSMKKRDPDVQNGSVAFPQQASVFFAGEIAKNLGTFLQLTYEQATGSVGLDNVDVRYVRPLGDIVWGITLNNNPTVQDVWNTTPAWGFPFVSSAVAHTPAAATLIDGALAQDVGGAGVYALVDNQFYAEFSGYASAHQGQAAPDKTSRNTVKGLSPYWRLAWQKNFGLNYFMVGTFGEITDLYPGDGTSTGVSGPTDKFRDAALDAQYERPVGDDSLTLRLAYIHEKRDNDASLLAGTATNQSDTLNSLKLNGTYHFGGDYTIAVGHFQTTGTADAALYATDNATGSPDSRGEIVQLSYLPWQNVQVSAQYTLYQKFNGSKTSYNDATGAGRSASDNDTLYLSAWLVW